MARVAIVTDSSADLTPDMRASGRITVVPAPLAAIRGHALALLDSEGLPKASPPALVDTFAATFTELARDHDAVVAVLLSSRLGGIVDAALQARERLARLVPIEVVDSRSASLGLGFQVVRGAELARQGMRRLRRLRRHCGPRQIVTTSSFLSRASSTCAKAGRSDAPPR